jgi:hypothetical protein
VQIVGSQGVLQPHALPLQLRRLLLDSVSRCARAPLPQGHCAAIAGGRHLNCTGCSRLRRTLISGRPQQCGSTADLGALERQVPAVVERRRTGREKQKSVRGEQDRPIARALPPAVGVAHPPF